LCRKGDHFPEDFCFSAQKSIRIGGKKSAGICSPGFPFFSSQLCDFVKLFLKSAQQFVLFLVISINFVQVI